MHWYTLICVLDFPSSVSFSDRPPIEAVPNSSRCSGYQEKPHRRICGPSRDLMQTFQTWKGLEDQSLACMGQPAATRLHETGMNPVAPDLSAESIDISCLSILHRHETGFKKLIATDSLVSSYISYLQGLQDTPGPQVHWSSGSLIPHSIYFPIFPFTFQSLPPSPTFA